MGGSILSLQYIGFRHRRSCAEVLRKMAEFLRLCSAIDLDVVYAHCVRGRATTLVPAPLRVLKTSEKRSSSSNAVH